MAAGPWSQLGAFFLLWERLGALFPGKPQQLSFFKRLAAGRAASLHSTDRERSAPAQPHRDPRPDPQFPPAASIPRKAGKNRQLVQREGSHNNERKRESETPSPSMQLGRRCSSCLSPPRFDGHMEEANAKGRKQHHKSPLGLDSSLANPNTCSCFEFEISRSSWCDEWCSLPFSPVMWGFTLSAPQPGSPGKGQQ